MRKLIAFDDDTGDKLKQLGRDRMATLQDLADEAFADLHCSFCQGAGLLRLDGTAKPAWFAFQRTVAQSRR